MNNISFIGLGNMGMPMAFNLIRKNYHVKIYDINKNLYKPFKSANVQAAKNFDELGKNRRTDWELGVIDELIGRRYNAMGCTLATTNYPPGRASGAAPPNAAVDLRFTQTLGDCVGQRVYSRLLEMCDFAELCGLDFRELRGR